MTGSQQCMKNIHKNEMWELTSLHEGEASNWIKVDLQIQIQSRWIFTKKEGASGCKRILSTIGH